VIVVLNSAAVDEQTVGEEHGGDPSFAKRGEQLLRADDKDTN
jgi:hypothetical protein